MVFVGRVIVWRKYHIKQLAGGGAGFSEKLSPRLSGFTTVTAPVLENRDHPPVCKFKPGYIPGIGKGMFRPGTGAVTALATARIGACMVGFLEAAAQICLGVPVYFAQPDIRG